MAAIIVIVLSLLLFRTGATSSETSSSPPLLPIMFDPVILPIRVPVPVRSAKGRNASSYDYDNSSEALDRVGNPSIDRFVYTHSPPHRWAYWIDWGNNEDVHYRWRVVSPPLPAPPSQPTTAISNHSSEENVQRRIVRTATDKPKGKYPLWKTSTQSRHFHCDILAINGGPFHADGTSCGPLVTNHGELQPQSSDAIDSDWIGIGQTTTNEWVLGSYHQFNATVRNRIDSFVTGFQWLIYNGTVVANDSDEPADHPAPLRAPRTAIGVRDDGSWVVLVIDGCEKCIRNPGLSLVDLAHLMMIQDESPFLPQPSSSSGPRQRNQPKRPRLQYAINLDGGSSSTLVVHDQLFNRPKCFDVDVLPTCERPVASVICISSSS